jgi:RNA polymerase sigma-70 factor (ECF subfamily)
MTTTTSEPKREEAATLSMSQQTTDEQLLLDYRRTGNQQAFRQLVERYEAELYGYLRRVMQDTALAEDVFQATFLQIHRRCDRFKEGLRVRPWLYTIATNQAIDMMRRNKRHRQPSLNFRPPSENENAPEMVDMLASSEPDPAESFEKKQLLEHVRAAVEQLPEALSAVVTLVVYQGFKYREAAEILSIPIGTVKSRMHTAVARLSEILKIRIPEEFAAAG